MKIEYAHISTIKNGDTIECPDGVTRTINSHNIKRGFMGITLWGDSYRSGTAPVKKVTYKTKN